MRKKSTRKPASRPATYSAFHVLFASATQPMPAVKRVHQLTRMWQGLAAIEQGNEPEPDDWRVLSDAVNLMETLVKNGHAIDTHGLLIQAIIALAMAGKRQIAGGHIRLDGPGIQAVRAVLEDYATALETLSERVMMQCHRDTEQRMSEICRGRGLAHDVQVITL